MSADTSSVSGVTPISSSIWRAASSWASSRCSRVKTRRTGTISTLATMRRVNRRWFCTKCRSPLAAPRHGIQRLACIFQAVTLGIILRHLCQDICDQFLCGGGEGGNGGQRVHHLMRHDTDHGLPGDQFLCRQFRRDVLKGDQSCRRVAQPASRRWQQAPRAAARRVPRSITHNGAVSRQQRIHAGGEELLHNGRNCSVRAAGILE